jgi:hypothetical protein
MAALDSYVLTTELDAVNICLHTIGEQPVSTLIATGLSDVAIAKTVVAEQNRRFQAKGWDFNTDLDYALALDLNNKCPVPPNALRIDTSRVHNLVQRAGFFWDRDDNTFTLTNTVYADIVRYLPYEDMPESARYYVALKAARIFQKRMLGDDSIEVFTEKDEFEAKADFHDSEQSSANRGMLRDPEMSNMLRAGRDLSSPGF